MTVKEFRKLLESFPQEAQVLIARRDYVGFRLESVTLVSLEVVGEWDVLNAYCRVQSDTESLCQNAAVVAY